MPVRRTSARTFGSAAATVALAAAGLVAPATSAFAAPTLTVSPAAPAAGSSFTVEVGGLMVGTGYRLLLTGASNTDRTDVAEANSCVTVANATAATKSCSLTEGTAGNYDLKLFDANDVLRANQAVTVGTVISIPASGQPRVADNPQGTNDVITLTKLPNVTWRVGATVIDFGANEATKDVTITSGASTDTTVTATASAGYQFADGTTTWQRTYRTTDAPTPPTALATPTAPVISDPAGAANDTVTLAKVANVTWSLDGTPVTFSANETSKTLTIPGTGERKVAIRAVAASGYYFAGNSPEFHFDYTVTDTRAEPARERVAGSNRFETANAIAAKYFPNTTETVYIANGLNFPDALSAGPAAARASSPLLLTMPNSLPDTVEAQVRRLQPKTINIVGGPDAVSTDVQAQLARIAPVTRLQGGNRYTTAEDVSTKWSTAGTVYIAFGGNFPDALSGGSGAAGEGAPLLLSMQDSMLPSTSARLRALNPSKVVLVGGTDVLTTNVNRQVAEAVPSATIQRAAGVDRYDTSAKIIENVTGKPANQVTTAFMATGLNFPDALAGVPAAKVAKAPLALSRPNCLPTSVKTELDKLPALATAVRLGGPSVIADYALTDTCG